MLMSILSSGLAYIFMLMEAMIDVGVHSTFPSSPSFVSHELNSPQCLFFNPAVGFLRETATTLVHHTILGSTLYAMEMGEHPTILRNSVTSPAGMTALALYELEKGRF